MHLDILTIVLDGMPYLSMQWENYQKLSCDWTWHIVEGAAASTGSTAWCKQQQPRLSRDGSTKFINSIRKHPQVKVYQRQWWPGGKDEMVSAPLHTMQQPSVLLESDADEIFNHQQIETLVNLFEQHRHFRSAFFYCRYWVGEDIFTTSTDHYGNRKVGEWHRAFRYFPGMRWERHEPPVMRGDSRAGSASMSRDFTRSHGLIFDHYSWALESQVVYKSSFYGYRDALDGWHRLQNHTVFPCKLRPFFPWVESDVTVDKLSTIPKNPVTPADKHRRRVAEFFQCEL